MRVVRLGEPRRRNGVRADRTVSADMRLSRRRRRHAGGGPGRVNGRPRPPLGRGGGGPCGGWGRGRCRGGTPAPCTPTWRRAASPAPTPPGCVRWWTLCPPGNALLCGSGMDLTVRPRPSSRRRRRCTSAAVMFRGWKSAHSSTCAAGGRRNDRNGAKRMKSTKK